MTFDDVRELIQTIAASFLVMVLLLKLYLGRRGADSFQKKTVWEKARDNLTAIPRGHWIHSLLKGEGVGAGNLRRLFEAATPDELMALLETVEDGLELNDIARCVVIDDDIRKAARVALERRKL